MRPHARFQLTVLAFALLATACSGKPAAHASDQTLAPLRSCEMRAITVDGTDLIVDSNADATLASVTVVKAPSDAARVQAIDTALRAFGPAHRDTRVIQRQSKWGLSTVTDACGRPVTPPNAPVPAST